MKAWFVKCGLLFGLGAVLDFFAGYLIILAEHFRVLRQPGLEKAKEIMKQPMEAFDILVWGGDQSALHQAIHDTFFSFPFQAIVWVAYGYFVSGFFKKKIPVEKQEASSYGSHGTARWANKKEYTQALMKDEIGFVLGEKNRKLAVHPLHSPLNQIITTFGGSGTGKSAGYSIPNILHIAEKVGESLVATDPKGELYNQTAKHVQKLGYDVIVFNLLDMKKSHRYNPLDYVHTSDDAMKLAKKVVQSTGISKGDKMWENAEMNYLAALILYLKETQPKEEQHLRNVLYLGTTIGREQKQLDALFDALPYTSTAKACYDIFRLAEDKTRAGILIGFGVRLQLWVSENVAQLSKVSDFDLNQLGMKKTVLYLLIPDSDSTFDLIPSMLIDQLFDQLYRQADQSPKGRLSIPVRFILDEFANIAAINDFERKVSTMRSRGISVVPILQSLTQFQNRYDHKRWSEILASSDSIVFLGTNDEETAKYFSQKLGQTTLMINSTSESNTQHGLSESRSTSFIGRSLVNPDELQKLKDEVIVFQRGQYPVKLNKYFYYKQKRWANLETTHWNHDLLERKDEPIFPLHLKVVEETSQKESIPEPKKEIKSLTFEVAEKKERIAKKPEETAAVEEEDILRVKEEVSGFVFEVAAGKEGMVQNPEEAEETCIPEPKKAKSLTFEVAVTKGTTEELEEAKDLSKPEKKKPLSFS